MLKWRNREVNLVVTDYQMPLMNGFQLAFEIRHQFSDLPVQRHVERGVTRFIYTCLSLRQLAEIPTRNHSWAIDEAVLRLRCVYEHRSTPSRIHRILANIDNTLADAVKVTLGPRGNNGVLNESFGSPLVTKNWPGLRTCFTGGLKSCGCLHRGSGHGRRRPDHSPSGIFPEGSETDSHVPLSDPPWC